MRPHRFATRIPNAGAVRDQKCPGDTRCVAGRCVGCNPEVEGTCPPERPYCNPQGFECEPCTPNQGQCADNLLCVSDRCELCDALDNAVRTRWPRPYLSWTAGRCARSMRIAPSLMSLGGSASRATVRTEDAKNVTRPTTKAAHRQRTLSAMQAVGRAEHARMGRANALMQRCDRRTLSSLAPLADTSQNCEDACRSAGTVSSVAPVRRIRNGDAHVFRAAVRL